MVSTNRVTEAIDGNVHTTPPVEQVIDWLGEGRSEPLLVPWDCSDGFMAAYWRRPERYLDPDVRACISTLSQLPAAVVDRGMRALEADLASGAWERKNGALHSRETMDYGYRLVVSPA